MIPCDMFFRLHFRSTGNIDMLGIVRGRVDVFWYELLHLWYSL